ncbi:hypothetical protein MJO29_014872 [Puccinia striiformis f. sp. tritici]|nr:hypothetical protein MJO29_014872 [Puccinia striiformis f. sp. tritici]
MKTKMTEKSSTQAPGYQTTKTSLISPPCLSDNLILRSGFPPQINGDHTTCINYGCKLDEQEYPLHCNGQTTFVRQPDQPNKNFGKVAYSKHSAITYQGNCGPPKEEKKEDVEEVAEDEKKNQNNENWIWETTWYFCLGVLTCDNHSCKWAGSPPACRLKLSLVFTNHFKRLPTDELSGSIFVFSSLKTMTCPGLAGHCLGKVKALCLDKHCKGFCLLRHKGCHNHPWPEAKKPELLSLAKFATAVENNPQASVFKLKSPFIIFLSIPSSFLWVVLVRQPGNKEGDTFERVTSLHPAFQNKDRVAYHWRRILVGFGLKPDKLGGGIGNMDNKLYSGGFLSDVTYRYFKKGYLMTTSMYCNTSIDGFNQPVSQDTLREFLQAVFPSHHDPNGTRRHGVPGSRFFSRTNEWIRSSLYGSLSRDQHASCHRQFMGVHRALLPVHKPSQAQLNTCKDLLELVTPDGPTHEQKIDMIYCPHPKVQKWLDWWTTADVSSKIFRARKPRQEDSANGLPDTTNGQELMHRL